MTLFEIIQDLHNVPGNLDKQAILNDHKDNTLLRKYMKAVMDPAINYYQTKLPKFKACPVCVNFGEKHLDLLSKLSARQLTGKNASSALASWLSELDTEGVELMEYIIKRKLGASKVGGAMVLKTWPGLFFTVPYMRCSSMSPKIVEHYRTKSHFLVQPKRDGSFAYLSSTREGKAAITRAGNHYPAWFAEHMSRGLPWPVVLIGEMEVRKQDGTLLDRKTGNGILNSVMQGEDEKSFDDYRFDYVAWDVLSEEAFKSGKSDSHYFDRLNDLENILRDLEPENITAIKTWEVESVEEAFALNTQETTAGREGSVWKTLDGKWKDTSSGTKDAVKLKVKFQVECKVTGIYEGEGKALGMLGGFTIATSDYKLQCNVGSGFSDDQRKDYWEEFGRLHHDDFDEFNLIATIEANDIITNKNRPDIMALSLPIFIELRSDRTKADTLARVIEQRDSARMGGKA